MRWNSSLSDCVCVRAKNGAKCQRCLVLAISSPMLLPFQKERLNKCRSWCSTASWELRGRQFCRNHIFFFIKYLAFVWSSRVEWVDVIGPNIRGAGIKYLNWFGFVWTTAGWMLSAVTVDATWGWRAIYRSTKKRKRKKVSAQRQKWSISYTKNSVDMDKTTSSTSYHCLSFFFFWQWQSFSLFSTRAPDFIRKRVTKTLDAAVPILPNLHNNIACMRCIEIPMARNLLCWLLQRHNNTSKQFIDSAAIWRGKIALCTCAWCAHGPSLSILSFENACR